MLQPYPYQPIGGINGEDSEDSIGPTEVREANNILFERKQFQTRPGLTKTTYSNFTGNFNYARSLRFAAAFFTVAISSNGKLYAITQNTEITGAGTTLGNVQFHNSAAVNDVTLVANNSGGMIRWAHTGFVYTVIAASNYRYVTSHLFRAVGAYKLDGAFGDPTRIGWSRSGDETNWAGGDSGTNNLVDLPDEITGIGVINNVLVIARYGGFHLGFATGVSLPTYRFETFGRDVEGCAYPATLVFFDNKAYYCSQSNVNIFNLQSVEIVGNQIRAELFKYLRTGITYRGFMSRVTGLEPRIRYNLVPMNATPGVNPVPIGTPHFTYDIQDKIWSRHTYSFSPRGAFQYHTNTGATEGPTLLDTDNLQTWDPAVACESPASLRGRTTTLNFEEKDMILRRVLLKYRNFGPSVVTCKVRAMLNETAVENDDTQQVGTSQVDRKLYRKWFNISLAGNGFEITLESPAGSAFGGNYLGLLWAESGEYKGEPGL